MTCEKINQNTAIINYQNTSFYVHCWRLPKEVKQKTVTASVWWDKGLWKTQSRQDKLLLQEKNDNSCMFCGDICMISYCNVCLILLTVDDILSKELRHCYGLLSPSIWTIPLKGGGSSSPCREEPLTPSTSVFSPSCDVKEETMYVITADLLWQTTYRGEKKTT